MRVYIPTVNRLGVRDMSKTLTLGRYIYDGYRAPAEPAAKAAMNPVTLGVTIPTINPPIVGVTATLNQPYPPRAHFAPHITAVLPSQVGTTYQSTSQQVANTPVPVGYPTDSIFINTDGSQWMYSSSAGTWINTGTPYNLNVTPSNTSTTTSSPTVTQSSTASTAAEVYGTPVPQGYPITASYIDSSGNTWQFNTSLGTWVVTALSTTAGTSAVTATSAATTVTTLSTAAQVAGTPVPVGYPNSAIYTDASGNTWQFSAATGTWIESATAASSFTAQVTSWLVGSTTLLGVAIPNAVLAGVVILGTAFLMKGKK